MAHLPAPAAAAAALLAGLLPAPAPIPPAVSSAPPEALAERGRLLVERHQCGACHRVPGVLGAQGERGPALTGFARRSYIAGALPNDAATLQRWIVDPPALLPGATMPPLGVERDEARAIAAYLHGLE